MTPHSGPGFSAESVARITSASLASASGSTDGAGRPAPDLFFLRFGLPMASG